VSNPTVLEMVKAALIGGGYDGLVASAGECACIVTDLAPCGEIQDSCIAGYLAPCPDDCRDHDFHIVVKKPIYVEKSKL